MPLVVLMSSVRTAVGFWDTGDLQTVTWIAGIPYPTGFPGYVLLGWLWTHVIPFGSVAARLNALSAIAVALASATIAALALQLDVRPAIALAAGATFAFGHTMWVRATYADVHPLGFALAFAAFALVIRWVLRRDARAFAAAILVAAVAIAVDNTTVLILFGALIASLGRAWPWRRAAIASSIALVVVVAVYAYLPLRSAYVTAHRLDPTLALGLAAGRPFWDDHHPATAEGFRDLVAGTEWEPGETLRHVISPDAVRAAVSRFAYEVADDDPQGYLVAAVVGLGFIATLSPPVCIGLALAAVLPALFGASYPAEADPERYAFALYAVAALGVAVAADRTVRAFGRDAPATALTVVLALLLVVVGRDLARASDIYAERNNDAAHQLGVRVAASTRDGAVVLAQWDWATALAYRAYVEHGLGTRVVVCALPTDYVERYAGWARTRQVVLLSDGAPGIPGFRYRLLSDGTPQVYEVTAR